MGPTARRRRRGVTRGERRAAEPGETIDVGSGPIHDRFDHVGHEELSSDDEGEERDDGDRSLAYRLSDRHDDPERDDDQRASQLSVEP